VKSTDRKTPTSFTTLQPTNCSRLISDRTKENIAPRFQAPTALEPEDIASAVLWLASDELRYMTGMPLLINE
jgi:NAD(P)-dependent dehydrogenase (short-subunit alcohol dehydrogenase family)